MLDYCLAYLEAKVVDTIDVGSHTIFIGQIINAESTGNGEPMTYDYYHKVKQGKSPKTAPTYMEEKLKKEASVMKKYRCMVCGYIYDPEVGDPDSGIAPGTTFESLPDSWVCPICGVGKDQFEEA